MLRFIFILLFFVSLGYKAQNITYYGAFPTIDCTVKLKNKWSGYSYLFSAIKPYESIEGNTFDAARFLSTYAEVGINYDISSVLSGTFSYVNQRSEPFGVNYTNENRVFQQLTLKLPYGRFQWKQRLRFDERFIKNVYSSSTVFKHRLRYLIGGKYSLNDNTYLMGYVESFFDTKNKFKYSENWSALQIGYKINRNNAIEIGYLFTGWIRNNKNDWLNQHFLQFTWVSQFKILKK